MMFVRVRASPWTQVWTAPISTRASILVTSVGRSACSAVAPCSSKPKAFWAVPNHHFEKGTLRPEQLLQLSPAYAYDKPKAPGIVSRVGGSRRGSEQNFLANEAVRNLDGKRSPQGNVGFAMGANGPNTILSPRRIWQAARANHDISAPKSARFRPAAGSPGAALGNQGNVSSRRCIRCPLGLLANRAARDTSRRRAAWRRAVIR